VNVDAIIFWFVHDAQKAALNITNYRQAIDRVSQTSLREMIGSSMLAALLSERTAADELLRGEIGRKTADWGISVMSVEIRDVAIPVALQDAMSRQAQAEREKQARVILGSAEAAIAGKFVEAAMTYADHPAALQLRAMNIIYETTKERGATILIPTSMVDAINPVVALALAGAANRISKSERASAADYSRFRSYRSIARMPEIVGAFLRTEQWVRRAFRRRRLVRYWVRRQQGDRIRRRIAQRCEGIPDQWLRHCGRCAPRGRCWPWTRSFAIDFPELRITKLQVVPSGRYAPRAAG
jgi:hypothetical protein